MTHNLIAETITIVGDGGDTIEAYLAQPTDVDQVGAIVVIPTCPAMTRPPRRSAGASPPTASSALMPNLYHREAPGAEPDDAAAVARASGGVPDERLVGDVKGAMGNLTSLPRSNGKVASIGYCSGGRQSFLAGCRLPLDAVIDCYGAFVVSDPPEGAPFRMTAVVDEAPNLSAPLLGLFGAEDQYPSPSRTTRSPKRSPPPARSSTFTSMRTPDTDSSPPTVRATARRPPTRAGTRSSPSSPGPSRESGGPTMCTYQTDRVTIRGSGSREMGG